MESKLLIGGRNIMDHTNEQQKMLELKRQEIAEQVGLAASGPVGAHGLEVLSGGHRAVSHQTCYPGSHGSTSPGACLCQGHSQLGGERKCSP